MNAIINYKAPRRGLVGFFIYNFIALRASAAVPPLICALDAGLGAMGPGGRAVVYGATGHAAGARLR